ncbi:MAG: hypothetical protein ACREID_02770 [Planctomycetota bacterium]
MNHLPTPAGRSRGVALLAALLFATTVLALSASMLSMGFAAQNEKRSMVAAQNAQEAAESGVHMAIVRLNSGIEDLLTDGLTLDDALQGLGQGAKRFLVDVVPAMDDGADNDLDGLVDEADEATALEVTSTGTYDGVSRTVRATLIPRYRPPEIGCAVYIGDIFASVNISGSSLVVSGQEVSLLGVPLPNVTMGIGVGGDPTLIQNQIKGNALKNIVGSPRIGQVEKLDVQALIEEGARASSIQLTPNGTVKLSQPGAWGTVSEPAVLYGSGNVHISGGAKGAGLLVVNGDLTISGGFEWVGLVIVRGGVTFTGGGGGKRLIGALISEEGVVTGTTAAMGLKGTVGVLYSSEAVEMAFVTTYTILNWREGANPREVAAP